jgi:DNA-binding transcriptional ArsR family regulator
MQIDQRKKSEPDGGTCALRLHKQMGMCLYERVSAQTKAYEAAGELLKVLSAPARLAIVSELAEQPRFVHELVERLGMSQPLVSQHLRVLRGARLVGVQRQGREAVYSLTDQHVAHIVADAVHHSTEDPQLGGHDTITHDNHVDYAHDGHRHAAHDGHYDEH